MPDMTVQEDRKNTLYKIGYRDGVYDQNHANAFVSIDEVNFGCFYLNGYKQGFLDAESRKWYVVSLDDKGKLKSWYIDGNGGMNSWGKTKSEATGYQMEETSRQKLDQLTNTVGRGHYIVVWR